VGGVGPEGGLFVPGARGARTRVGGCGGGVWPL